MLRWLNLAMYLALAIGAIQGQEKPRLTFEVASIKLSKSDPAGALLIKAMPGGQEYTARNVPVKLIFALMYKVRFQEISGGPDWLENERYDIEAKADHPYSLDDLHVMFQNLLADEFKLKFHIEKKPGSVYALLIDKSGSKMKVNESPQDFDVPMMPGGIGKFTGKRVPIATYFCWWLSQRLDRPVIDKTELDKFYDFTLEFAPEVSPGIELPQEIAQRPALLTALKEQLGLRLEAQKGLVDYYVIDQAEKPAAN